MILRSAAIHEAGHAAIALAIRVRRLRAVLEPDGGGFVVFGEPGAAGAGRLSECERNGAFPDYAATASMLSLAITLAGRAAERLAGFDGHQRWFEGGDRDQVESDAVGLAEMLGAPASLAPRIITCGTQDVDAWLTEHWLAVVRVADALLVELQLDHDRIAALAGALPRPDLACLRATALSLWTRFGARTQRVAVAS